MKESYKTQFELVRDVWPDAHAPDILLTHEEKVLAGRLLQSLLREMIEIYNTVVVQYLPPEFITETAGDSSAFIAHQCITVFERTVHTLEGFGIVSKIENRDRFRVLTQPCGVPGYVLGRDDLTREMFAWVIEACLNFGWQKEWRIPRDIVEDFISAGLVEVAEGTFDWTDKMIPYCEMSLRGYCTSAPEFFDSICG